LRNIEIIIVIIEGAELVVSFSPCYQGVSHLAMISRSIKPKRASIIMI